MVAINRFDYLYREYSQAQLREQELRLIAMYSSKDKLKRDRQIRISVHFVQYRHAKLWS